MSRFANLMGYIDPKPERYAEEAPSRPEFERGSSVIGVQQDDPEWRDKAERFVLANTPARHKFGKASGSQAIVYFDSRGRAASAVIGDIPDDELACIVAGFSRRGPGEPQLGKPSTSSKDHGYGIPVQEVKAGDGLGEGREDPALALPGDEKQTKRGAFKVSSKVLDLLKKETGVVSAGDTTLRSARKIIDMIPQEDLPKMVGGKDMPDAQDRIANKPRDAFHRWLAKLRQFSPRAHKHLQSAPDDTALMFYIYMRRVSGTEMADILFRRYFQTKSGHPGELKRKDIARELERSPVTAEREGA